MCSIGAGHYQQLTESHHEYIKKTCYLNCNHSTFTCVLSVWSHKMTLQAFQLSTFTDHSSILTMRAAQHPIHIRALVTCQNSRFHPTAMKIGHQNWARSLTIDSTSCCNCTCRQCEERVEPLNSYSIHAHG